jgi:hypothetical protein
MKKQAQLKKMNKKNKMIKNGRAGNKNMALQHCLKN